MTKRSCFYFFCTLYGICVFLFLKFPFRFLIYTSYQGEMIGEKEAIIVSKTRMKKRIGFIDSKEYAFQIVKQEKYDEYYLITILFEKKQPTQIFNIYIKKNHESIWKLLFEEWRSEWKN